MKRTTTLAAAALLCLSGTLVSSCSKTENAVSATSQQPTAVASAPPVLATAPPVAPAPALQPTPGSPVATFTPRSDTPAPMLPTLGSAAVDEHGHSTSNDAAPRIHAEEAAMLVQSGDAIILDVRPASAYAAGHIKGAVNIPYDQVASRARAELPPTRWIIPYCT